MDARGSLLEVGISITLPKAAKPPSRTSKKKGEGSVKAGNTKPKVKVGTDENKVTEEKKKVTATEETAPQATAENDETSVTETDEVAA
ncbi:MAG: hypothetical protein JNG84_09790 [Archangium sp.]|nr:hypothetical protein [Archangium sp.]